MVGVPLSAAGCLLPALLLVRGGLWVQRDAKERELLLHMAGDAGIIARLSADGSRLLPAATALP